MQNEKPRGNGTSKEHSLIILKSDAVEQEICLEVLRRIVEETSCRIVAMKIARLTSPILREHYAHIADKPFFPEIEKYMMKTEVWIAILEGRNGCIEKIRNILGATNPNDAADGTIRAEYGKAEGKNIFNVAHASDSTEAARREIPIFFREDEVSSLMPDLARRIWTDATEMQTQNS